MSDGRASVGKQEVTKKKRGTKGGDMLSCFVVKSSSTAPSTHVSNMH